MKTKELNWYVEHWNEVLHDYAKTSQEGLVAEYYWRVMCYLEKHNPSELMREDFRLNCERIYEEIPGLKVIKSYYDLYNSHELQEILEAWNDLFIDELDNDE